MKKIAGAYGSQTDLLNLSVFYSELIDFQWKRHHILTSNY